MYRSALEAYYELNKKFLFAAQDRPVTEGIPPEVAYELGYETALKDLYEFVYPPVLEVGLIDLETKNVIIKKEIETTND